MTSSMDHKDLMTPEVDHTDWLIGDMDHNDQNSYGLFITGNSCYGPLHLWSMSLMGHQVVVMVQYNYGPGHLWATT